MDAIDDAIVRLLRGDGRMPYAAIGREVRLSTAAVKRRVERLEEEGVITGYAACVDHHKLGLGLEAFVEVRFAGSTAIEDIWSKVTDIPEIEAVYATAGDLDVLIHTRTRDIAHLADVIARMRRKREIIGTRTLIVLEGRVRTQT